MKKYEMFDDYMAYNEETKQTVSWFTYGDNEEYFLSKVYSFENDFCEPIYDTDCVLVNCKIDDENTLESLIEKSLEMVF